MVRICGVHRNNEKKPFMLRECPVSSKAEKTRVGLTTRELLKFSNAIAKKKKKKALFFF